MLYLSSELALMDGVDGRPLAWSCNGKAIRVRPGVEHEENAGVKANVARMTNMKLAGKEIIHQYSRMLYDPMVPTQARLLHTCHVCMAHR